MSGEPLFVVSMDPGLRQEDRDSLFASLQNNMQLHPFAEKRFGPEWTAFVAYAKDIGEVAGAATAMIKLANTIISWLRDRRAEGPEVNVNVIFQRPGRSSLKLADAKEAEIVEWCKLESRP